MAELDDLSVTDASNTARFPEAQSPSSLNNGARALEGMIARYIFDLNTGNAATVSGSVIQVTVNRTSITLTGTTSNYRANLLVGWTQGSTAITAPCSLNLGLGPISLRDNSGISLSANGIPAGARCLAVKDDTNNYFRKIFPDIVSSSAGLLAANNLSDVASASTSRTNLGLGTAATQNTGTSGANVPLLNAANTHSALTTFSAGINVTPAATPATNAAGYLGSPVDTHDTDYTLVMSDVGKTMYHTSASTHTWTIPSNVSVAFPVGTVILFKNENGGGNVTIAINSDTLRWGSSTGSRTLAANGSCAAQKVTATLWRLTGDGIT